MKIIHIIPGKVWGGAEQFILDLSKYLAAHGHEIVFVARESEAVHDRLADEPFKTEFVNFGVFADRQILPQLADMMIDADVVHIHDVKYAGIVSRAKWLSDSRAKIILTRHVARAGRTLPWRRDDLKMIDRMIFVSELGKRLWLGVNSWFPEDKTRVVINSIPPMPSAPIGTDVPSIRKKYGIPDTTPLLLFTGRVRKSKGCEVIVKALAKISDRPFEMVFVGACKPTNYNRHLAKLAKELGIGERVHFYGFTSDVRRLIGEADLGLAPSIVREACHLSPLEFMQAGKCVITTNNGAQPEYITDGETGLLVSPDSVDALAAAIARMLDNPAERRAIGEQAAEHFDKYLNYDRFVAKILRIYGA